MRRATTRKTRGAQGAAKISLVERGGEHPDFGASSMPLGPVGRPQSPIESIIARLAICSESAAKSPLWVEGPTQPGAARTKVSTTAIVAASPGVIMPPASASSTVLRVKASDSPARNAAAAIVVLLRQPTRRPPGLPDWPL